MRNIKSYDFFERGHEERNAECEAEKIEISDDETRRLVMQGMSEVTDEGGTAGSVFADYPIKVGGKTGTAEMLRTASRSTTVCSSRSRRSTIRRSSSAWSARGAGHGAYVAPVVRDMLDEFFTADDVENVDAVPTENTLLR